MKLIDTHAHIYLKQFDDDLSDMFDRCERSGVSKVLMPNIDSSTVDRLLKVESEFPQYSIAMMGLHPCSVKENYREELSTVNHWFEQRSFIAVGEIGTDLYWDRTFKKEQIEALEAQIELAISQDRPIVLHCRNSLDLTIDIVEQYKDKGLKGVFHCFTGDKTQAGRIMDMNFYLGIGGIVTFKNGGLDKIVPYLPLDKCLLETDSPYLAPVPYRGKRNESSYIPHIAQKIARLKQKEIKEIADVTTQNAIDLFGIEL